MRRCLILCKSGALSASLKGWLPQASQFDERQLAFKNVGIPPEPRAVARSFEDLSGWIESESMHAIGSTGIAELVVITDLCGYGAISPHALDPLAPQGWATVLGMLILGFPEVHWVFASGIHPFEWTSPDAAVVTAAHFASNPRNLSDILCGIGTELSALFDPTGLRNAVRASIGAADPSMNANTAAQSSRRTALAIAIDEERSYSWLHAYTAYRFGFRAQAVTTYGGMEVVLKDPYPRPLLVFEDYFLQFGDYHPPRFSHLRERDNLFSRLAEIDYRIFITSGHHHGQDQETHVDNPVYRRELRGRGKWNCELHKPSGGIFDLRKRSGLSKKLTNGLAPGFNRPGPSLVTQGSHSAPGRILIIADRLIKRAERVLPSVRSVPQAVYGALLAMEALELLGYKTPTTSLDALSLKHQFEVLAECQFGGVEYHIALSQRLTEIKADVHAICKWFQRRQQPRARPNAEMMILIRLVRILREYGQFDEEQVCLRRVRHLHNTLWSKQGWGRPLLLPFLRYLEVLLSSFSTFILILLGWVVLLALLFLPVGEYNHPDAFGILCALQDSVSSFFTPGAPIRPDNSCGPDPKLWSYTMVSSIAVVAGFVHLGVFIAHLYAITARR